MKCSYCNRQATHRRTPDIDIKGVALCDEKECFYRFIHDVNARKTNTNCDY